MKAVEHSSEPGTAEPPSVVPLDVPREPVAPAWTTARAVAFAVCVLLVGLPFLVTSFPPITDLPQHVAQVRLFIDAWNDPSSLYRIQWQTPYSLVYALLGAIWAVASPLDVGRYGMLVIGGLWALAAHGLAARRGRPLEAAVLATPLFFNHATYWGFYNFLLGWPLFVLWLLLVAKRRETPFRPRDAIFYLGTATLLFFTHALWFAAGILWLVLSGFVFRVELRRLGLELASLTPIGVPALLWYLELRKSQFSTPAYWIVNPLQRLSPDWLQGAVLGGLWSSSEGVFLLLIVLWAMVGVWQKRRTLLASSDRLLLLAAAMFAVMVLVLPYKFENTIQFAERWAPPAATLLLIGLPSPDLKPFARVLAAFAIAVSLCLSTTLLWVTFEEVEMSGLAETLDALPEGQRVLGLDLIQMSSVVRGRPFIQGFAYAQVARGGRLNFSFAQFKPSLVIWADPKAAPWTSGLEWLGDRVKTADFKHFDYVIVNAAPLFHQGFSWPEFIEPVTSEGRWRLYRVRRLENGDVGAGAPNE